MMCTVGALARMENWGVRELSYTVDLKKEDIVATPVQLNLKLFFDNMNREKMVTEAE